MARVLRELEPDVVCLQEVPRLLGWRLSRHLLARRSGLVQGTRGRSCGVAVWHAPSVALREKRVVALPKRPGLHRRAVAVARLEVDGVGITVASTHLDLEPAARLDSAARVRAAVLDDSVAADGHGGPGLVVVGADVNEQPGGPTWAELGRGLVDARAGLGPTFPSRAPDRRIDGLWVGPGLQVHSARVVAAGTVSDHLPILVELHADRPRP